LEKGEIILRIYEHEVDEEIPLKESRLVEQKSDLSVFCKVPAVGLLKITM